MSAPLRVGFVGVGGMRIAYYHAREFAQDPRVRLVACCDIVQEALISFGAQFSIPPAAQYADFETMLQQEGLDIAVVCTNETLHAEMAVLAASHVSSAVVCDKPMAMCLREADAMLDACRERGLRLIVGHQRRYQELYAAARDRLLAGRSGSCARSRRLDIRVRTSWRTERTRSTLCVILRATLRRCGFLDRSTRTRGGMHGGMRWRMRRSTASVLRRAFRRA